MNTCLSGLWDILIEQYYREMQDQIDIVTESDCKAAMGSIIDKFYDDGSLSKPQHIEVFRRELLKDGVSIHEAADRADKVVKECKLCVSCMECARVFYGVLQGKNVERPLPFEIKDYFAGRSQLYYYLSAYKTVKSYRRITNTLICLKGFSSTTPAIYSATFEDTCTGGGIYINVDEYGIAIDPGLGFVDSMHRQGIFIEDINTVVVTHNHLDHNADIGTISALLHDMNRYYDSQVKFYKRFFRGIQNREHTINWWLDEGTQAASKEIIPTSECLSQCQEWVKLHDKVSMMTIETKHMREGKSYAIKIKLDDVQVIVGYTSDTRYFPELTEFMHECDIIIFNISDIYEKDVRGTKQKHSHLGYNGSVNLLQGENQHFSLAIASEFCCNNGDYRMSVAQKLNDYVRRKRKAHIIPGEIGLKIDLQSGGIYCSRCKQIMPLDLVSVVSSEREFGEIQYVCKKCQYR